MEVLAAPQVFGIRAGEWHALTVASLIFVLQVEGARRASASERAEKQSLAGELVRLHVERDEAGARAASLGEAAAAAAAAREKLDAQVAWLRAERTDLSTALAAAHAAAHAAAAQAVRDVAADHPRMVHDR